MDAQYKMKTDIEKLQEIFKNQSKNSIKVRGWDDCSKYLVEKKLDSRMMIQLSDLSLGFVFNRYGRFVGICNWKE